MLEEAEARVRRLRAELEVPVNPAPRFLQVLPQVVDDRLNDLHKLLAHHADEARTALARGLGTIVLRPTPAGLVAELRGNTQGLLTLDEQAPMSKKLVAGGGFEPPTFGL